ncbi:MULTISPECIES: TonB-dependent receptor [unclassified Sphingopyxis]|jgi:outer membrane receptor protein involved in Fe transport|uniref:TonB-dependent receptor n=1 Tax=unclassified Sphingopyxis TaxID=2614943 RepID=UPI0025D1815B|nr:MULTISPECIES: TonB-dependent receptor [unclassified Sphingopyxis]
MFSAGAAAQEPGVEASNADEIVVTARFREESIQDIGGSIAALDGAELQRSGIVDFEDLANRVAGVELLDRGPNTNEINIRGVTNSTQVSGNALQPLVSILVDDISVASSSASQRDFNFFDFDRVEVLRGPQPTYFGEGAMGGVIRYFSADPDLDSGKTFEGTSSGGVSTTNNGGVNYRVENATSLILVPEKLGIRIVGFYRKDDGYIDNLGLNKNNMNDFESFGGRAIIVARPTENLTLRLAAHVGRDDIGELNFIEPTTIGDSVGTEDLIAPSLSLIDGLNQDDFELYSGKISYNSGPITIESITGLYKRRREAETFSSAYTYGFEGFFNAFPPFDTASNLLSSDLTAIAQTRGKERSVSQEFRFVSDYDSPLNVTAGAFFQDTKATSTALVTGDGYANITDTGSTEIERSTTRVDTRQFSGFVELSYDVSDRLRLFAGARYVNEKVTSTLVESFVIGIFSPIFTDPSDIFAPIYFPVPNDVEALTAPGGPGTSFDFKLNTFLPRVAFEYDITRDVMLYGTLARGVRNGGLNSPFSALGFGPVGSPEFEDALTYGSDDIVTGEIGIKSRWMDGDLTFNIAGFYSDFDNPQIGISNPGALTANGPQLRIYGLEVESVYKASSNVSLFFSGNLTEAEYTKGMSVFAVAGAPADYQDLAKGNRPPNVPSLSFSTGADLRYPLDSDDLELTGQIAFQYIGERETFPQNFATGKLGSMEMLNLRVGLEREWWSLTAYMTNVLNDLELQATTIPTSSARLVNGVLDGPLSSAFINRPRTTGLTLTVRY